MWLYSMGALHFWRWYAVTLVLNLLLKIIIHYSLYEQDIEASDCIAYRKGFSTNTRDRLYAQSDVFCIREPCAGYWLDAISVRWGFWRWSAYMRSNSRNRWFFFLSDPAESQYGPCPGRWKYLGEEIISISQSVLEISC